MEFSFSIQLIIFIVSGAAIWYFCNKLSDVVEFIDAQFGLGDAFGGTLILSVVTNLPEIAIAISGAVKGNYGLVTGNLLGGIAIQTMLFILYDFKNKDPRPLSTLTSSKVGIFQGFVLILILVLCLLNSLIPEKTAPLGAGLSIWAIALIWLGSLLLIKKFQKPGQKKTVEIKTHYTKKPSLLWLALISVVVLFFGILLETSSDAIASHFNLSGVFFGATVLALVTSLPEISSGLEFEESKDFTPIISDIFGGNSFLPVLFLPASIIAGKNIIGNAGDSNNLLAFLTIILTSIFLVGMHRKSKKKIGKLGWDNWLILIVGMFGFAVLYYISKS